MKIKVVALNKTDKGWIQEGVDTFFQRVKRYISIEIFIVEGQTSLKKSPQEVMRDEGQKLLKMLRTGDFVVLLDEKGKRFGSEEFAGWLNQKMIHVSGDLVFLIGGAYGFDQSVRDRANETISLSDMTFTHQMIRILFLEQLYRAFTILRNEPYHHS
ncbi:MAG: 23S rRNA (pseudouridine(1915)-N(3))-methyltransferase RlmH [Bacteroidia bacterium]